MTISIISTNKDLDIYNKCIAFLRKKGIATKLCGPYNKEHKINFNLPKLSYSPFYTYKSDLVDFLNDINEMSGNKDYYPYVGIVIYTGDGSKEIFDFISKTDYESSTLKDRLFFINSSDLIDEKLNNIYDKSMIVWTKFENTKV